MSNPTSQDQLVTLVEEIDDGISWRSMPHFYPGRLC